MSFITVINLLFQKLLEKAEAVEKACNPNKLCLHFLRGMQILLGGSFHATSNNLHYHESSNRNELHTCPRV